MQNLADPAEREETLLQFDPETETFTPTQPQSDSLGRGQTVAAQPRPSVQKHFEVEDRVKRAEEQLAALQQKREELEKRKQELQQLSARRKEFAEGKDEVIRVLTEALPELRDEADQAQRRSEFLRQMREVFGQHLEILRTVTPEEWDEADLQGELERGTSVLEEAKAEIERFEERLSGFTDQTQSPSHSVKSKVKEAEFAQWMKMGFAFALPIMIFTAFTLVVTYLILS